MGRNNEDFKFERKLTNAIGRGVRDTDGVKTTVRVSSDWDKEGSPFDPSFLIGNPSVVLKLPFAS